MDTHTHITLANVFGQQHFDFKMRAETAVTPDEKALVRLFSGLDYSAFRRHAGRPCKVDPLCMMILLVYGGMQGRYSSRELETLLVKDIFLNKVFEGVRVDHNTINNFVKDHPAQIDDVFRQLVVKLSDLGEVGGRTVFQDGTKIESFAGRYTFKWKKAILKLQPKAVADARALVARAVALGAEVGEHDGVAAQLRTVVSAFQDSVGPERGKGHRKNDRWRIHDQAGGLLARLDDYRLYLHAIGDGRESCSRSDPDATFMHLKEDHMRNGQLKPAYNVQNAVDSGYVVCCTVSSDRNDYHTAIGMLEKLARSFPWKYHDYCADSGYDTLENFEYCREHGINALIYPHYWGKAKTRAFKNDPGKVENMAYDEKTDSFTCRKGHRLRFSSERKRKKGARECVREYVCERGCRTCPFRSADRSIDKQTGFKHVSVMLGHMRARKEAQLRLSTREGAEARLNRSIQAEGSFAEAKQNLDLRRFASGGMQRVLTEWIIRAMAQDVVRFTCRSERGVTGKPFWISIA